MSPNTLIKSKHLNSHPAQHTIKQSNNMQSNISLLYTELGIIDVTQQNETTKAET